MEGDNGSLVNRSQNDSSLLADEELDIGDNLVENDNDLPDNGGYVVDGQRIRSGALYRGVTIRGRKRAQECQSLRSCWVSGVRDVVAVAKICGILAGVSFLTRAASGSADGAAKTDTALSAKVAKVAMDLNNIVEDELEGENENWGARCLRRESCSG